MAVRPKVKSGICKGSGYCILRLYSKTFITFKRQLKCYNLHVVIYENKLIETEGFLMNFNKILKASTFKLYIFIALLILMVAVGCSNKVDSSQTQAPPIPITGQESAKNTFGYTVEIPNGWRIINNDSKHLELATIEINNNNYFVNPSITIFIPDIYPEQYSRYIY